MPEMPIPTPPGAASAVKTRSCVVCRSRKVRCDRQSPCSNCRAAGIECLLPAERPPRWARRLQRNQELAAPAATSAPPGGQGEADTAGLMERLRSLESLVKELSANPPSQPQLPQAQAESTPATDPSPGSSAPPPRDGDGTGAVQRQISSLRLVDHATPSRFWTRINQELRGLEVETRDLAQAESSSEDEAGFLEPAGQMHDVERTPAERHGILFGHGLGAADPGSNAHLHPLPSQVPYLLDIFQENVGKVHAVLHMPTIAKMVKTAHAQNGPADLSPPDEAILFAIYYAAIASMEDDDVLRSFGSSRAELSLKYRIGLERTLAAADLLNSSDLRLLQAFLVYLALLRRQETSRYVWMLTGVAIRMGLALGLNRDPTQDGGFTPFEAEMRRRAWWALVVMDVRSSEDQGTSITLPLTDVGFPANIDDADIDPGSERAPPEREGLTDAVYAVLSCKICDIGRRMVQPGVDGPQIERLLAEMDAVVDEGFVKHSPASDQDPGTSAYWARFVFVSCNRLVSAKMRLLANMPLLFSSPSAHFPEEMRTKLLVSALEVAEYHHSLNAENNARNWRWVYQVSQAPKPLFMLDTILTRREQTYTQWHAVIYMLIEIARRPWSALLERVWTALHSPWLIPVSMNMDKNSRVWTPLKKLMAKARRHREAELERLRGDAFAARQLASLDDGFPLPSSPMSVAAESSAEMFRARWRELVNLPADPTPAGPTPSTQSSSTSSNMVLHPAPESLQGPSNMDMNSAATPYPVYTYFDPGQASSHFPAVSAVPTHWGDGVTVLGPGAVAGAPYQVYPQAQPGHNGLGMLWADTESTMDVFAGVNTNDMNMDIDTEDWYSWVQSAQQSMQ
ncbi:hypothetical protein S7711_01098 [Stachybotrys chartarum IBT 7711]|uniref:Zn(2)-C6 fungal-type domain-containing protein n=1 Tax=Stachybotrys chartarum (strain CBS 109288 / IBT 7711) TaxID=1280523 RepID=A0A084B4F4_STACB|nr:hypothetical protein S7711_01098 [Stachybotrys chartarum IBT 7711]